MNAKSIEQLLKQVIGVSIGDGADYPSFFEGYDGEDGILQIRETVLGEYLWGGFGLLRSSPKCTKTVDCHTVRA